MSVGRLAGLLGDAIDPRNGRIAMPQGPGLRK
jgi:hypothetical protein